MTPSEACALLERYQDYWPDWLEMPAMPEHEPGDVLPIRVSGYGVVKVALGVGRPGCGRACTRPGLSDEENVRRILAAAEKGYRQRQTDSARS